MEKEEFNCNSDSSEDLPDLWPKRTFDVGKLEKNEIVWAPYRDLHWPAMVRSVDKKNKKVKLWYLDSPGKCFKVPFKKIRDFNDLEFSKAVNMDAKLNSFGQKHHEVFRRSLMFIFRRSRGIEDNPADFFDTSRPYFVHKDLTPESLEVNKTIEKALPEIVGDNNDNLEESSETESDEESYTISKSVPELYVEDSPYNEEMVDKILSCVIAGHVDEYLMNVFNCKIASERHDLYVEAMKTCNTELLSNFPSYIPINNREKLHNVSCYLFDLYKRKIGSEKPKMTEYVVSVWLPEAIDKAISLIKAGSQEQSIHSGNNNKSSSSSEASTLEMANNSSSDKLSCSSIGGESSKSVNMKLSTLPTEVKLLKAKIESTKLNDNLDSFSGTSIKLKTLEDTVEKVIVSDRSTSPIEKEDIDSTCSIISASELLASSGEDKHTKFTGRKKRKGRFKTLTSPKKLAIQKMIKPKEDNFSDSNRRFGKKELDTEDSENETS